VSTFACFTTVVGSLLQDLSINNKACYVILSNDMDGCVCLLLMSDGFMRGLKTEVHTDEQEEDPLIPSVFNLSMCVLCLLPYPYPFLCFGEAAVISLT
jgi:hypothetical protein